MKKHRLNAIEFLGHNPYAEQPRTNRMFFLEFGHLLGITEFQHPRRHRKQNWQAVPNSFLDLCRTALEGSPKWHTYAQSQDINPANEQELLHICWQLVRIWASRILFLKFLEAQLLQWNQGDEAYSFFHEGNITSLSDLQKLFFDVLNRKPSRRKKSAAYPNLPYLSPQVFEPTALEQQLLSINQLPETEGILRCPQSILTPPTPIDTEPDAAEGSTYPLLSYLLEFLNAWSFGAHSYRPLINLEAWDDMQERWHAWPFAELPVTTAAMGKLIRGSIRASITRQFNEKFNWDCDSFSELSYHLHKVSIREANAVINQIRIGNPFLGTGQLLVTALNELLLAKSKLHILMNDSGQKIWDYHLDIEGAELYILDEENNRILYQVETDDSGYLKKVAPELTEIQAVIFREKCDLISECLYGVSAEETSVHISKMRLWLSLLQHAYYTEQSDYEILPPLSNATFNLGLGNALVRRFDLTADLEKMLQGNRKQMGIYRSALKGYKRAQSDQEKSEWLSIAQEIQAQFSPYLLANKQDFLKLKKLEEEFYLKSTPLFNLSLSPKQQHQKDENLRRLSQQIVFLKEKLEIDTLNPAYKDAFEWRYLFPKLLDDQSCEFLGFDLIVLAPHHTRIPLFPQLKTYLKDHYKSYHPVIGSYAVFTELAIQLCKEKGHVNVWFTDDWQDSRAAKAFRKWLSSWHIKRLVHFDRIALNTSASYCLLHIKKQKPSSPIKL